MDLADIGPRPRTVRCVRCNRSIRVKKTGRLPTYCSSSCKQAVFHAMKPKPNLLPKVPIEDRVALRIWQALVDAKLVTGELPPPRRKTEDAA